MLQRGPNHAAHEPSLCYQKGQTRVMRRMRPRSVPKWPKSYNICTHNHLTTSVNHAAIGARTMTKIMRHMRPEAAIVRHIRPLRVSKRSESCGKQDNIVLQSDRNHAANTPNSCYKAPKLWCDEAEICPNRVAKRSKSCGQQGTIVLQSGRNHAAKASKSCYTVTEIASNCAATRLKFARIGLRRGPDYAANEAKSCCKLTEIFRERRTHPVGKSQKSCGECAPKSDKACTQNHPNRVAN